jgi:hypothetical protein
MPGLFFCPTIPSKELNENSHQMMFFRFQYYSDSVGASCRTPEQSIPTRATGLFFGQPAGDCIPGASPLRNETTQDS